MSKYTYTTELNEISRWDAHRPIRLVINLIESKTDMHHNSDGSITTTNWPDRIIATFAHATEADQ